MKFVKRAFGDENIMRGVYIVGSIGIWQLLTITTLVALLFGTRKLRGFGSDLGIMVKEFKSAVKDETTKNKVELDFIKKKNDTTRQKYNNKPI